MHPNAAFRWEDEAAMRTFVAARGFATLCVATPEGKRRAASHAAKDRRRERKGERRGRGRA